MDASLAEPPPASSPVFGSSEEQHVYGRLRRLIGEGPAIFFRDAAALRWGHRDLNARSHLVGHLVRDVESALRAVCAPAGAKRNSMSHAAEVAAVCDFLNIAGSDPLRQRWRTAFPTNHRGQRQTVSGRAHRDGLGPVRVLDSDFGGWWDDVTWLFRELLDRTERRYALLIDEIEQLALCTSPTKAVEKRALLQGLPNTRWAHDLFFARATSPAWIRLLRNTHLLAGVPQDDVALRAGSRDFSRWAAAPYLLRMLGQGADADAVVEVLTDVRADLTSTAVPIVMLDVLSLSMALPVSSAVAFQELGLSWGRRSDHSGVLDTVVRLGVHWVREGEVDAGLALASAALAPFAEAARDNSPARRRIDLHSYDKHLKYVVDLVDVAPMEAIHLLSALLDDANAAELSGGRSLEPHDFSYVWRPTLGVSRRNLPGHRSALVRALREAVDRALDSNLDLLDSLIALLTGVPWRIHHRMAFRIAAARMPRTDQRARTLLLDETRFHDRDLWVEYTELLRRHFPALDEAERARLLGWVTEGQVVDREHLRVVLGRGGEMASDEAVDASINFVLQRRLDRLRGLLPDELEARLLSLDEEFGPVEMDMQPAIRVGPELPMQEEEFMAMGSEQILDYLGDWEPPSGASPWLTEEGPASLLRRRVAADPERDESIIQRFSELRPAFLRGLLRGFVEAGRAGRALPWASLLELGMRVAGQRAGEARAGTVTESIADEGSWRWATWELVILLELGIEQSHLLLLEHRDAAWELVGLLLEDPDPSTEDENVGPFGDADPAGRAINSIRGRALELVLRYASGLATSENVAERAPDGDEGDNSFMTRHPEVAEILLSRLDPAVEPTLAVRSVFGWRLRQLVALDGRWVEKHLDAILPPGDEPRWWCVWLPYVVLNQEHPVLFDVLQAAYARAVRLLGDTPKQFGPRARDPEDALVAHLVGLFFGERLSVDEGLLREFVERAPDAVRASFVEQVGRALWRARDDESIESGSLRRAVERSRVFWERRVSGLSGDGPAVPGPLELGAIGWWLVSGLFEPEWILTEVERALDEVGEVEPSDWLADGLASVAKEAPSRAVSILSRLLDRDDALQHPVWSGRNARTVLQLGLAAEGHARAEAEQVVNRLVARGIDHRELLNSTAGATEPDF